MIRNMRTFPWLPNNRTKIFNYRKCKRLRIKERNKSFVRDGEDKQRRAPLKARGELRCVHLTRAKITYTYFHMWHGQVGKEQVLGVREDEGQVTNVQQDSMLMRSRPGDEYSNGAFFFRGNENIATCIAWPLHLCVFTLCDTENSDHSIILI